MKPLRSPRFTPTRRRLAGAVSTFCLVALWIAPGLCADETGDITAVSARVSSDYIRPKLPNGTFEPEAYAFGEGGHWSGRQQDNSIDPLRFVDVARMVAGPLSSQNYVAARDPARTRLLIMVYWGTTDGTAQGVDAPTVWTLDERLRYNPQRDRDDDKNAQLLGYDSSGLIGTDYGRNLLLTALHRKAEDLVEEIEDNRYFVVLMAYDFQLLRNEQKHKLLWETRFSIRERNNDFNRVLPDMARYAARYFGQDSHGLIRRPLPIGHVKLDELKILDSGPDTK